MWATTAWSKANEDYYKIHFAILNVPASCEVYKVLMISTLTTFTHCGIGQHTKKGYYLSHSTDQGHNMMTLPLAKSLTTPMHTHTLNIWLTLAKKPLTVMRIDGGVKSIGSPAQELLSVPSLLVWKKECWSLACQL